MAIQLKEAGWYPERVINTELKEEMLSSYPKAIRCDYMNRVRNINGNGLLGIN